MADGYLQGGKVDVAWWGLQLAEARRFREKYTWEESWAAWRRMYRGDWQYGVQPSNIFFKMLRTVVPRIYFRNPSVSIQAKKPGLENLVLAQILERIDNKLYRRMRLKQQIKKITQRAFMFGTDVGKLGFGAEFSPSPTDDGVAPTGKKGRKVEYNPLVEPGVPWFMSCHPGAFLIPSGSTCFEEAPWYAHYIRRPKSDVVSDPRLKNTAGLAAGKASTMEFKSHKSRDQLESSVDMIDMFEIRDKRTQEVFVIAPWTSNESLYQQEDELQYLNRVPFHPVVFNADDEYFWGTPDSKILEPIQLELNETKTQIMKHRRLSVVKLLARRNSITVSEAAKMVDETVAAVVWTEDDPDNAVSKMVTTGIPNELFAAMEDLIRDARETVGFSRNAFGEFKGGSSDTTATEARIVAAAAEIRVDERRDMLADMIVDVTQDMHQIIFDRFESEQVIDLIGPDGALVWVHFKTELLKEGRYEVSIDPDSSVPETRDVRAAKAERMFTLLNGDPMINQARLRQNLLREMGGVQYDDMILQQSPGGNPQNPISVGEFNNLQQGNPPQLQAVP